MEQIDAWHAISNQGVCASEHQINTETATLNINAIFKREPEPEQKRCRAQYVQAFKQWSKGCYNSVNLIPLRYFVLDGYFGHNNALQMAKQCRLHLISKLRTDAALHLPPTTPYAGKGRPRI